MDPVSWIEEYQNFHISFSSRKVVKQICEVTRLILSYLKDGVRPSREMLGNRNWTPLQEQAMDAIFEWALYTQIVLSCSDVEFQIVLSCGEDNPGRSKNYDNDTSLSE